MREQHPQRYTTLPRHKLPIRLEHLQILHFRTQALYLHCIIKGKLSLLYYLYTIDSSNYLSVGSNLED